MGLYDILLNDVFNWFEDGATIVAIVALIGDVIAGFTMLSRNSDILSKYEEALKESGHEDIIEK